jgi:hypothetical protein
VIKGDKSINVIRKKDEKRKALSIFFCVADISSFSLFLKYNTKTMPSETKATPGKSKNQYFASNDINILILKTGCKDKGTEEKIMLSDQEILADLLFA